MAGAISGRRCVDRFIYECGDLQVDPANRRLTRAGGEVALEPKAFSLLLVLLDRADELVTREELLDAVWGHRYIAPATLNRVVTLLRRVLDDDADRPHAIQTVHGAGYRFIGSVRRTAAQASDTRARFGPSALARLPAKLEALVGRERELEQLIGMLSAHRAVTIVGPGGTGKTQCALEVARLCGARFPDDTWFFDLSPLESAHDWLTGLAAALNIPAGEPARLMPRIVAALAPRRALLVVDNCDQLAVEIGALVFALVRACPELKILSTSQRPLDFIGERLMWLTPLALPPPAAEAVTRPLAEIAANPAVALLLARARAVQPAVELTAANVADIVEICHRLDGMPLALELAAAHFATLSPATLRARLRERLSLLASDSAGREPRHRNLHALVEWSFGLLSAPEQRLLCWLGVFLGGWAIDATEDIGADLGLDADTALALHSGLILKSLVTVDPTLVPPRYRLLETVRESALRMLRERGEEAAARTAHLRHLVGLAERSHSGFLQGESDAWVARLGPEHPNIDGALRWACGPGDDRRSALRLVGSLMLFTKIFGSIRQIIGWAECALDGLPPAETTLYLRALLCSGMAKLFAVDGSIGAPLYEAAALAARLGDVWAQGCANAILAQWFANAGRIDDAQRHALAASAAADTLDDAWLRSLIGHAQGWIALQREDPESAIAALEPLRGVSFDAHQHHMINMYVSLAHFRLGHTRAAAAGWCEGLDAELRLGNLRGLAGTIEGASYLAMGAGQPRAGARWLGKAAGIREITTPLFSFWLAHHDEAVRVGRASLGTALFESLHAEGAVARDEAIVGEVRAMLERLAAGQDPAPADA
jgi:predicted ATPase/DNA-binding winged helix-turn-helix (wHTH) protein